jgi:hypothetical protein
MMKRLVPAVLAVVCLTAVSPALSRPAVVKATGVITPSGKGYLLTVTNTGRKAIPCFRFRPTFGVKITSTAFGHLAFNTIEAIGPRPKHTTLVRFRTKQPYPARSGGTLELAENRCHFPGQKVNVSGPR